MTFKDAEGREFEILETSNDYAFLQVRVDDGNYKPYVIAFRLNKSNGNWESAKHYEHFDEAKAYFDAETQPNI